jgi:hypothetical protein
MEVISTLVDAGKIHAGFAINSVGQAISCIGGFIGGIRGVHRIGLDVYNPTIA